MVVTLSVLAGACPAYAAALVDGVAEAEGVAAFVFREPVVALGAGVGVAGEDGRFDRRPPGVDGGGEAVDLRGACRGGAGVEPVQRPA